MVVALLCAACSGGDDESGFESNRPRPTDDVTHDHSGEVSALAPETVLAEDIAALGDGVAVGDTWPVWIGVNICGRFLEIPAVAATGGLAVDSSGLLTVAPGDGDEVGHAVTIGDVMSLVGVELGTGSVSMDERWAPQAVDVDGESVAVAGSTFSTGDPCVLGRDGAEPGEVQLWYYTPAAVDSGTDVRLVVTDPEDVPIIGADSAITIAFAPVSSLPTLPPAALVG